MSYEWSAEGLALMACTASSVGSATRCRLGGRTAVVILGWGCEIRFYPFVRGPGLHAGRAVSGYHMGMQPDGLHS